MSRTSRSSRRVRPNQKLSNNVSYVGWGHGEHAGMDLHAGRNPYNRCRVFDGGRHVAGGPVAAREHDQFGLPVAQLGGGPPGVFTGRPADVRCPDQCRLESGFGCCPGSHFARVGPEFNEACQVTKMRQGFRRPRVSRRHRSERKRSLYDLDSVRALQAHPPADPGERVDKETDTVPAVMPLRRHGATSSTPSR